MSYQYYKVLDQNLVDISRVIEDSAPFIFSGASATAITWSVVYQDHSRPYAGINSALTHLFISCGVSPGVDTLNTIWHPYNHDWYPTSNYLLVGSINDSFYDHKMLGNTMRVELPYGPSGVNVFYGSLYANNSNLLGQISKEETFSYRAGGSICWLMNNNKIPYSGPTIGNLSPTNANSAYTNWSNHQYACSSVVGVSGSDIPYGFVLPDRGIICLMNTDNIIASGMIPVNMGQIYGCIRKTNDYASWAVNTSGTNLTNMSWTGAFNGARSTVEFKSRKISMKHTYFCVVAPNEFNFSTNPTWDRTKANSDAYDLDDIYITEIALCNEVGTVIAYGKTSQPVRKNRLESLTFKVELVL